MLIPLTKGKFAIIDDEDFELIKNSKWHYDNYGYAHATINYKQVRMHRLILGLKPKEIGDHINGDRLDNRRSNLRVCSFRENLTNKKISLRNKCGYKGVYLNSKSGKKVWRADVYSLGKKYYLGLFETKEEAAKAYDEGAKKHHGEFASLNFKENQIV